MNLKSVISLIDNPEAIGSEDYAVLNDLSEKYPWFSSLHILKAKCLKNENKYGFKQAIKLASIYAGDREILFDVVNGDKDLTTIHEGKIDEEPELVEDLNETEKSPDAIHEDKEVNSDEVDSADEFNETAIKKQEDEVPSERPPVLPIIPEPIYDPIEMLGKESEKTHSKYNPDRELSKLIEEIKKPGVEEEEKTIAIEEDSHVKKVREKHDFLSWFDEFNDRSEAEKVKQIEPKKPPMSDEAKALLENFLKNRPSIRRIKPDTSTSKTPSKEVDSSDNGIVTESLAKLYLKQNNPERALEVYKKLQLQFPQKFSYFAALIEEVQNRLNNSN